MGPMPKGDSGRVVIDIEPGLKRRLYSVLAMEDSTLKEWFIAQAEQFIRESQKPSPSRKKEASK